jgi:hypothetical protein
MKKASAKEAKEERAERAAEKAGPLKRVRPAKAKPVPARAKWQAMSDDLLANGLGPRSGNGDR